MIKVKVFDRNQPPPLDVEEGWEQADQNPWVHVRKLKECIFRKKHIFVRPKCNCRVEATLCNKYNHMRVSREICLACETGDFKP